MASFLEQIGVWPYILAILPHLIFLWALFCLSFPIHRTSDLVITLDRLQRYIRWVFKVCQIAIYRYLIICLYFALLAVAAPSSRLNGILIHSTECAHRFSVNRCDSQKWVCSLLQKECFALSMCISQPKYLTILHEIFFEWGHQLWSSLYWLIALVSLYVLMCVRFLEEVVATAADSPGGPPPMIPPQRVGRPSVTPSSSPQMRLRPPTPDERLNRHDRPEFPLPPALQVGIPLPPQERRTFTLGVALPSNGVPELHGNEVGGPREGSQDTPTSENTTLLESEAETDSLPDSPSQSPGIPNRNYVQLLRSHRLMILAHDADLGPAFALPRGVLVAGNDNPPNHMVDERGARFRIRDLQENILTPEEVLRILDRPPPAAQPPIVYRRPDEVDEEQFVILEPQRQYFQTDVDAQSHILVLNNMFPIPIRSFRGGRMHLPEGSLLASPFISPHAMVDNNGVVFIVYDQEDQPVDPVHARAIMDAERL